MLKQREKPDRIDAALKQAVRHPTRLALLGFIADRKTGVDEDELSKTLNVPPARVKYHLKVLQSADLVAHVDEPQPGMADRYIASAASS